MIYVLPASGINARFAEVHPWYMSCLVCGAMNKEGIGTMNIHMTCWFYSSLCGVARIRNIKGNRQSINPSVLLSLRKSDQGVPTKTRYPSNLIQFYPAQNPSHSLYPQPRSLRSIVRITNKTWSPFTFSSLVRRTSITLGTIEPLF